MSLIAGRWAALTTAEQGLLAAFEASRLKLSEDVQALAALVECLQRRVRELETEKAPVAAANT
jgi:hypothetical protein